jgi:hypothetical protein
MDRHIEMMMAMEKALIQAKCIVQPSIYIMPEVDRGIVGKLKIVTALIAVNLLFLQIIYRKIERHCQKTPRHSY